MFGHFGFSYIGLLLLLMLFIPNLIWAGKKPQGYSAQKENNVLVFLERIGEALTCCCALIFSDFNLHTLTPWCLWLAAAFLLMILYELWWIRYFRSPRRLEDFYSGILGIPLAGATLPVIAFFLLGVYGKVPYMLFSALILGIGHIGIHMQHKKQLRSSV